MFSTPPSAVGRPWNPVPKVLGTWQWAAYAHDAIIDQHKIPLLINIDESPMPLAHSNATGNIVRWANSRNNRREPRRAATRNEQRIHFTYIAMICNIPWIQEFSPQILVVPERVLPIHEWRVIAAELPENVYLLRQPSMWVTSKLHSTVLRLLRKCLKRLRIQRRCKVILFADSFGGHTTIGSMNAMRDYHFYFVLLPAGLTWLLQPLDVQTFVCVKRFLRDKFGRLPPGGNPVRIVLQALRDVLGAIAKFFVQKDWSTAFDSLGLNGGCSPTSRHLHTELEWPTFPAIPRARPTPLIFRRNTPGGRELNAVALAGCMPPIAVAHPAPAAPPSLAGAAPGPAGPPQPPAMHRRRRLPAPFL